MSLPHNTISIHAPTRGATLRRDSKTFYYLYFNPRSHKGSDDYVGMVSGDHQISIHAPTRGATSTSHPLRHHSQISIHAPTRGATRLLAVPVITSTFQSTLPQGERHNRPMMHICSVYISIHAPTRGATYLQTFHLVSHKFQSTLPQGERPTGGGKTRYVMEFQSTLPQGERRYHLHQFRCHPDFNPRSHKGSDVVFLVRLVGFFDISIHAPTRGATVYPMYILIVVEISIHAPTRGATLEPEYNLILLEFQSTLPQGERRSEMNFFLQ